MRLLEYVQTKMAMSSPYQPLIIKMMVEGGGEVTAMAVATKLSKLKCGGDERSAYYEGRLKVYPRKVLEEHGIATLKAATGERKLTIFVANADKLPTLPGEQEEYNALIDACSKKLTQALAAW